jgi:hypothetical protein
MDRPATAEGVGSRLCSSAMDVRTLHRRPNAFLPLGMSLAALPRLWAETSDAGRRAIAEATVERVDVLGVTDYTFALTTHAKAHGWDVAFGPGVVSSSISQSGRGERHCPATTDLPVIMRLAEPPEPCAWLRSA